jgi:hypothetical protein
MDSDDDDEDEDCVDGGGGGAGAGAGGGATLGLATIAEEERTVLLPVVEKMTRFAVPPAGTVTTQNSAPPAPTLPPEHLLTPIVLGLHSQGIPLQLPPGQSIRIAKPGSVVW